MSEYKQYQTPATRKVAKVAACITILQKHLKQNRQLKQAQQENVEVINQFDDQAIMMSELQKKFTPQKPTQNLIPSNQTYPVKSLGQRPLIRFIQKSKQIMKISQIFRPAQSIYLNDSASSNVEQLLNQSSTGDNEELQNKKKQREGKNQQISQFSVDSPNEIKYKMRAGHQFGLQNSQNRDAGVKTDWNYQVKTEQDEMVSKDQSIDHSSISRPSQSASGRIFRSISKQPQLDDKYMQFEERKYPLISQWNGEIQEDKRFENKNIVKGRQIKGLFTAGNESKENQFSIQNNNFMTQQDTSIIKRSEVLPQFGNFTTNQSSIRTRSCEIRVRQNTNKSFIHPEQIKSQTKVMQSSQNYNDSLSSLTYNDLDQNQIQEEQQDKQKSNQILRLILKQIHKNDQQDRNLSNEQQKNGDISIPAQNEYFENKDRFIHHQDGLFFKQAKNSQKLLNKLQNKSSDAINQIKHLQNIQIKGQSLTNQFGRANIEKIIKTLKQQKERQAQHPLSLKGSQVQPKKQEENSQNPNFQCWNDHSEQKDQQSLILHINSLNKNPRTQVKEYEIQKVFQNQSNNAKRQCCKTNGIIEDQRDSTRSPTLNKDTTVNQQQIQNKETQNSPIILSGVNLNPNSNHINFKKYTRKEPLTKQAIQKENNSKEEISQQDENKQCNGWEQTSAFTHTAESLFLEFVQTNLKRRQNLMNIIKN